MRSAALALLAAAIVGFAGAAALRGSAPPRFSPLLARMAPELQWAPGRASTPEATAPPGLPTGARARLSIAREFPGVGSGPTQGDPPDPVVGVGAGDVVQMVNDTVRVWTAAGVLRASYPLASFMEAAGPEVSDPRVVFDPASRRWFASAVDVARASVQLAVSAGTDPAGSWTVYSHATGSCPDQPSLGVGADLVVVGYGAFATPCLGGSGYLGGGIVVYDKRRLLAGTPSQPVDWGPNLDLSPVTAVALSGRPALAVALSLPPPAGGPTYLVVLRASGAGVGTARLAIDDLTPPPPGEQPDTSQTIETGDVRIQSAVMVGGTLWAAGNVGCVPHGDGSLRACLRMVAVSRARIALDTDVGVAGRDLFYPALAAAAGGDLVVVYGSSSRASNPALAAFAVAHDRRGRSTSISSGTSPDISDRFGDYFGAAPDAGGHLWVTGETSGSPTADASTDWLTTVAELNEAPGR